MKTALRLERISAGYDADRPVLRDISLDVNRGEMIGILGPNGAGKTTLFRILSGLMRPREGNVRIFGKHQTLLTAKQRAQLIGVAPQNLDGPTPFSVYELVAMSRTAWRAHMWQFTPSENDRQAIERTLHLTDLSQLRHRPLDALSGGEKQRAIVAMAIAREPPLLLLDEATSHLDMSHRLDIMQIVERLNREQGVTVLMISHDINLSADFCRRLLMLDHGSLVADGTPEQVLHKQLLQSVYHCNIAVSNEPHRNAPSVHPIRAR